MPDGSICQRCGVRPAVATVRRVEPGQPSVIENLCQVCLAEGRLSPPGRHGGPFDELLARLFGQGQPPEGTGAGGAVPQPVQQVDITQFFSDATRRMIQRAGEQAMEWGSLDVDSEHLLWGALQDEAVARAVRRAGCDPDAICRQLEQEAERREPTGVAPSLAPDAKRALLAAYEQSRRMRASYLGPEHVLLALAADPELRAGRLLARAGLSHQALLDAVRRPPSAEEQAAEASRTPTLDRYGRDLTQLAREGRLDPVIGRELEIEQTIEVLSRRTKNNPVLIGDPGVGKTAIVEGIAQAIVTGESPAALRGRRLVALDVGGLLAGTRYRGEFEQRMTTLIDEITQRSGELILFIDELHTIVGAGGAEGAVDAANMLKPALARGELHVVGATTLDEYRRRIEQDAALERRFQPILVDELSVEDTIQVLLGLKDRYEAFHRVRITDEAVRAAAELSDRYVTDRFLPDKAIDLVDQAGARIRLRAGAAGDARAVEEEVARLTREKDQAVAAEEYERAGELKAELDGRRRELDDIRQGRQRTADVTPEDVAEVVARLTGIPVAQLTETERDRLLRLEERLHQRVVDQDEAVAVVAEAIRRNRAGLSDPHRPVGTFLFLGPTGVGKTELARALAEVLFGDDDVLIRLDMSEYQERHTVSRLVGAPPGYVGYEEAGQLTEQVRRKPYSVLLLDEVEKAHPDVFNLLLQLLDDGRLTDAQGRTVDFRNTVVVMTSNFGAERIGPHRPQLGFGTPGRSEAFADVRAELLGLLRREFRPEFLNRIDEIVVFRPLERPQLLRITRMLLDRLAERVRARDIDVAFEADAVAHIADQGYDPEFGARPLRRAIQRLVENELSTMVLREGVAPGDRLTVVARDGELRFEHERDGADGDGRGGPDLNWEEPGEVERPDRDHPVAPRG